MIPGLPTRGHHVFVPRLSQLPVVHIDGEEGHHLAGVLRVRVGQLLSVADGTGLVVQAEITEVGKATVTAAIRARHELPEVSPSITVVQGLPKGRKMDEIVQRLTEVGADRIRPVTTERSIRRPDGKESKLLARWQSIAVAAAQQSRRARLPVIDPIRPWAEVSRREQESSCGGVVLWEDAEMPLSDAMAQLDPAATAVTLLVGPEGGLSAAEVQGSGLIPCRLGPTILRTETAGIVGAALIGQMLGRYA